MPVHSITITDTYIEIDKGGNILHFNWADFPPSAGTNQKRQEHIIEHVQSWLDTRIKINTLPADDPYRLSDPALPHLFWEGSGGNTELVCRNIVIENVVYDSTQTPPIVGGELRRIWP